MINYRKTWQPPIRCNYWMSIIQLCCPQRQFGHPWKKKVTQERIEIKFGKMKLGVQRRGENGIWYRLAHGKGEKCEASTAGAWPVRNVWNVCLNKCSNSKITEVTSVGEVTVLVTGLRYSLILLKSNFTDPDFVFFFPYSCRSTDYSLSFRFVVLVGVGHVIYPPSGASTTYHY